MTCHAELRRLSEISKNKSSKVGFIIVAINPLENIQEFSEAVTLRINNQSGQMFSYMDSSENDWNIALPLGQMLADFKVRSQSTKIAIDSNGVIVYRDGYGKGDEWLWETIFDKLGS